MKLKNPILNGKKINLELKSRGSLIHTLPVLQQVSDKLYHKHTSPFAGKTQNFSCDKHRLHR